MPPPAKSLILCVHAHQPVGNFDHVLSDAFERAYRPFFETLERHPGVRMACHFSGSLLDWLEREQPAFLGLLRRLEGAGRIEILGGAYYEPVFGAVPERDLSGQIQMMRARLKELLGVSAEGAWLTERVWDPELAGALEKAGIAYTVLDDLHFKKARVGRPSGYYRQRTLSGGGVDLFAARQELRYLLPFRRPEEALAFIRATKASPGEAFVFADDCEKFGLWPGTHDWVYRQGWLERFFSLLEADKGITLHTFGTFRRAFGPRREVSVPHGSYSEMMQWSGGRFYNFFDRYAESRYMRDRMWQVSSAIEGLVWNNGAAADLGRARLALYRSQCNCGYWHGVFGGLYLHHLRSAVFTNLIEADALVAHRQGRSDGGFERIALGDSGERWRLQEKEIVAYFDPSYGAALEELDHLPTRANLTCALQRRRETYHAMLAKKGPAALGGSIHALLGVKEPGLEKSLQYDRWRRLSFLDHFFEAPVGPEEFAGGTFREAGDFVDARYAPPQQPGGSGTLSFARRGSVVLRGKRCPVELEKTVVPAGPGALAVRYRLRNPGSEPLRFVFGVEWNFSMGVPDSVPGARDVREHVFRDAWRGVNVTLSGSETFSLMAAPVETVSGSEAGLERTYQGLGVLAQSVLEIGPGGEAARTFTLTLR